MSGGVDVGAVVGEGGDDGEAEGGAVDAGEGDGSSAYLANEVIRERDGDRCARPAEEHSGPLDVHHRMPRSGGRDERACNRVTLCRKCHDYVHRNPRWARQAGWIVSRSADPADVPVDHVLWPAGPVLLLDDGGIQIWQDA